jgi:hypothetical protein
MPVKERTIRDELGTELLIFNRCVCRLEQSLWVVVQTQDLAHPLTSAELKRMQVEKVSRRTIAEERIWRKRLNDIAIKRSTKPDEIGDVFHLGVLGIQEVVRCYGSVHCLEARQ